MERVKGRMPSIIDNRTILLKDDLAKTIRTGSRINIAASCFSIYAFREMKKELENIDSLRFLFTSPTFVKDKTEKEKREFYIPRITRENSLSGSPFEIRLRNELSQKAISKECAKWISQKVTFKSNKTDDSMSGFMTVSDDVNSVVYTPVNGFTSIELGCERGNNMYSMINKLETPYSKQYLALFDSIWNDSSRMEDVTETVLDSISEVYAENSPDFLYYVTLYNIFNEFLRDVSEDVIANDANTFKQSEIWKRLYAFQRDAALGIINKLETYNGCILADSVGLGKTYTALAVIKYYELRNKTVLVLCPKKLAENWNTFKGNYCNNPISKDRLRYDVLFHTDLSRDKGQSNGIDLSRINWGNYDFVVIDESHNFRNGGLVRKDDDEDERENRYLRLMNQVIKAGVKTKVLMLSATPVNNKFTDLRNQLAIAYEGDSSEINGKLRTSRDIDEIFRSAQKEYNRWSKLPAGERTLNHFLDRMDFDFFEVLDSVTIARSRKHIQQYYDMTEIGKFPQRLPPVSLRPKLTSRVNAITFNEIFQQLSQLNLNVYVPSNYIYPSKLSKYEKVNEKGEPVGITMRGREQGIRHLMAINLLKRLESSVHSFRLSLERVEENIQEKIRLIDTHQSGTTVGQESSVNEELLDDDGEVITDFHVGKMKEIDLDDMDFLSWRRDMETDIDTLDLLVSMVKDITPEYDAKLHMLMDIIAKKEANPINPGNRKLLIFTAFADTASYLYENISTFAKKNYGMETAMVYGGKNGKTTIAKLPNDFNTLLTYFSPISKEKDLLPKTIDKDIDILIGTDCISEGQNLQDCDCVVNYDIHWNPVRIIQRFGRIDRIGSRNEKVQLVNFWPDISLDGYIQLKARVEMRMKIVDLTATADDNILSPDEQEDLDYRKEQLKRLQTEVVDLEDMNSGVSITDLGLNDFRMDLVEYLKVHKDLGEVPMGLDAVLPATKTMPAGVVFILRNINNAVNIDKQNRLHPYYMVYLDEDGNTICNHLEPKRLLDMVRGAAKGKLEPNRSLCKKLNQETNNGQKMGKYSGLLQKAIGSILNVKEQKDVDSLFSKGETTALVGNAALDDFELVCFFIVEAN